MLKTIIGCLGLFFSIGSMAPNYANDNIKSPEMEHSFIEGPNHQQIEFFTLKPQGQGPFPIIFLLDGYQPPENSVGGKQLVDLGYLDNFVKEGVVAVSISIPGFGQSDGSRDFSGPDSQKAIATVIEHYAQLPFVDSKRMGIYGISRGAILASMVHKYASGLLLQVLEGGWYDLTTCSSLMPNYLEKIKKNIVVETKGLDEELIERSAIYNTQYVNSKTLILLGEFDDRRTLPSSKALHEKLVAEGKDSQIKIFPNELHVLSADKWSTIIPFIRQHFFNLYGIGIQVSLIMPAIQISKILPNSSAERSGQLKVGDVILRISPNNDENEIDALRMPVDKFTSLVLGKKGTSLRLYIQHFDQTYEDVVIQRG